MKSRRRYVAGIVYKGRSVNDSEIDIESLKGKLWENVLCDFEICKNKLRQNGLKGKAAVFELVDMKLS